MFFIFRWLLILFRREFSVDDGCWLMESVLAKRLRSGEEESKAWWGFAYFIVLSILEANRDQILQFEDFDSLLRVTNAIFC